jgi:P-type Ca2+ transporter type 2C
MAQPTQEDADPIVALPRGLSSVEAAERLRRDGYNELPHERRRSLFAIALAVVREPMLLLLVAATILYLVLGDLQEAIVLVASLTVVIGITLYQEHKTERALDALRDLSSPRAEVIRDGQAQRIAGREVVMGDVLVLAEGDRVPADAIVRESTSLSVDESLLTGESAPVRKQPRLGAEPAERAQPGGDDQPYVYSSTLVVSGRGIAEVSATGARTEIGRIGKALVTVQPEETPLQREVGRLARVIAGGALVLCIAVIVIYVLVHHDWIEGILAGITLAMALIPEEFPLVLAIFLALGAWRIAQRHVLTRRMPAIEALGATTVLCVDKTGTLTLNRMAVSALYAQGDYHDIAAGGADAVPETQQETLRIAILASQAEPFDPMERALVELGARTFAEPATRGWALAREYPLTPERLAVTRAGRFARQTEYRVASKGAPEAIAALCRFDDARLSDLHARVSVMADQRLRVRVRRPDRPGRSHPSRRARRHPRMLYRGAAGRDDHRRLSTDGPRHRAPDRATAARGVHHWCGAGCADRCGTERARQYDVDLCPGGARTEVAAGRGVQVAGRGRRHDGRRRQRRAGAQGGAHWRGDGRPRHGCRARGGGAGAARR